MKGTPMKSEKLSANLRRCEVDGEEVLLHRYTHRMGDRGFRQTVQTWRAAHEGVQLPNAESGTLAGLAPKISRGLLLKQAAAVGFKVGVRSDREKGDRFIVVKSAKSVTDILPNRIAFDSIVWSGPGFAAQEKWLRSQIEPARAATAVLLGLKNDLQSMEDAFREQDGSLCPLTQSEPPSFDAIVGFRMALERAVDAHLG